MALASSSTIASPALGRTSGADWPAWRWAATGLLSVRFIQGFIYWGGGSRRFIYAPGKLDPDSPHWMANKFQSAMPGALLGTDHLIAWMLHHFWALYPALIVFSGLELLCGLGLIFGFLTRLSAAGSVGFSLALMLMFGWQGATCIDEWTMAASNLAMGATLVLLGAGAWSLDAALLKRWPALERRSWFRWTCGALPPPLSGRAFMALGGCVFAFTLVFNVATYNYYRGSVISPFHSGPVSASKHHYTLTDARLDAQGGVSVHAYLDGGTPAVPSHIMVIALTDASGQIVERWDTATLAALPKGAVVNDFEFNRVKTGPFGLSAEVGAEATLHLPSHHSITAAGPFTLVLTNVSGKDFKATVQRGSKS